MDLLDRLLGRDQWATARLLELSGSLTDGGSISRSITTTS